MAKSVLCTEGEEECARQVNLGNSASSCFSGRALLLSMLTASVHPQHGAQGGPALGAEESLIMGLRVVWVVYLFSVSMVGTVEVIDDYTCSHGD